MNLADKITVITGGSKGFGKGLAKAFADKGAKVIAPIYLTDPR
jgi:NAD(P)-dependent dehydrogenase (short-subunit alcohol dehydrogenase family)